MQVRPTIARRHAAAYTFALVPERYAMRDFAQRLMMQGQMAAPSVATAIFGTAGSEGRALYAGQPPLRIGLWPLRCDDRPLLAMGLFTLLGFLLERWRGVRVYRLAARLPDDATGWQWEASASQFSVDDWQLEELDDNVGIWGELEALADGWRLSLSVEDDRQAEEAPPASFVQDAASLPALAAALPDVVTRIMELLGAAAPRRNAPLYSGPIPDESALDQALQLAFRLELQLYLQLWGQTGQESGVQDFLQQLERQAGLLNEFGPWLYAGCVARRLHFGEDPAPLQIPDLMGDQGAAGEAAAIILAEALFSAGDIARAFNLLESYEGAGGAHALTLADLYRRSGRVVEAVDVLQDAIEAGETSSELLVYYGDLLQAMDLGGLVCESTLFVDPDQDEPELQLREALAAWEAAEQFTPEDPQLLQRFLVTLAELESDDPRFWPAFGRLVQLEDNGEALRQVIDASHGIESLEPAQRLLQAAFEQSPGNLDLGLCLAEVLLLEQEGEALELLLGQLAALAQDEGDRAELARLRLMADEPEFEMRLGEIDGVLSAGNVLDSEAAEWLEAIMQRAPGLGGLHAILARAYLGWGETATAVETLLDGYRRFPADAELAALLGEQFWLAGEGELAFEYLGQGLANNPEDVTLLALTGQYLLEDGQVDAARACLARAEAIAPRHPALAQARAQIASLLGR